MRLEWWAVITNDLLLKAMSFKDVAYSIGCCLCGGGLHGTNHFWPLWMSINHNEVVVGLAGGKLYMFALLRSCRLWPREKWCCLWSLSGFQALFAPMCSYLDVAVFSRPPYMTVGSCLYLCYSWMCLSLCSSLRICSCKEGFMTICRFHIRQPCSTESSSLGRKNGLSSQEWCTSGQANHSGSLWEPLLGQDYGHFGMQFWRQG